MEPVIGTIAMMLNAGTIWAAAEPACADGVLPEEAGKGVPAPFVSIPT